MTSQTPKKRKKRKKKTIAELNGPALAEKLLGQLLKKELDKKIEDIDRKGVPKFMQT